MYQNIRTIKVLTVLTAFLVFAGCGNTAEESTKPNIILVIIDTLRADHLGCYGYQRETSPVLDSLAESGVLFSRCQSQAPWTLPSIATIWTGLSVVSHQARRSGSDTYGVDGSLPTIASALKDEGYVTLGFVNVFLLNGEFGFDNCFDHYSWYSVGDGRAEEAVSEVLHWFDVNRGISDPKLVVLHLYDVHSPYDPPAPFDMQFSPSGSEGVTDWEQEARGVVLNSDDCEHLLNLYDGEIAWVDSQLGRLFAGLRSMGVSDNSIVIVTSDHGEEFFEHGRVGHGQSLYQECLHVPLIISGTGIPIGLTDTLTAGLFDILPTIAGCTGISLSSEVEGVDLFQPRDPYRSIPSSGMWPDHSYFTEIPGFEYTASVLSKDRKGIVNFDTGYEVMFDLQTDPQELEDLPLDPTLLEKVELYWLNPPVGHPSAVSSQSIDQNLQDLGYI